MKHWKIFILVFATSLAVATAAPPTRYVEGEAIVTFKATASLEKAKGILGKHAALMAEHFPGLSARRGRQTGLARDQQRTTVQLIADLKTDPDVETAEPNYLRWVSAPNDARFNELWALRNLGQVVNGTPGLAGDDVKFLAAWNLARSSPSQRVVGILDTGVNFSHPDLVGNMWTNTGEIVLNNVDDDGNGFVDDTYGYNFSDNTSDPSDSGFHGTHVAGTVAATGHNQLGILGVDFQAKIMALRVSSDGTAINSAAVISALQYATMMKGRGVNIVALNASFGGGGSSTAESAAIQSAGNAGIIFCAAAGNEGANNDTTPTYPASYRLANMIVVGASEQGDALASFSNYGATTVDLAAPGVNILSTAPVTAALAVGGSLYVANPLSFSGATAGVTGTIHDCGLGNPGDFPAAVNGNIALIARGTITFAAKVTNAMAAGARAAIIYNNVSGAFSGTLQTPAAWIPAVAISQASGNAIRALVNPSGTVIVTAEFQFLEGTSMATPHVAGAVAFAALNFPDETVAQRIQRILTHVDGKASLQGKVATGGRLNLQRIVDTDSNALPDWWERIYFNQLTGVNPNGDLDADGQSNLREFLAGTLPGNAQSALRVATFVKNSAGGVATISWTSVPGKIYQVSHADFLPGAWLSDLPNSLLTAAAGQTTLSYTDATASSASQRFYRIEIVQP